MFIVFGSETFGLLSIIFLISIIVWAIYYFILKPRMGNIKNICPYCGKAIFQDIMFCPFCERLIPIEDIKKLVNKYQYQLKCPIEVYSTFPINESHLSNNNIFPIMKNEIITIVGIGEKLSDDNIWLQIKTNDGKKGWCTSKIFLIALFS